MSGAHYRKVNPKERSAMEVPPYSPCKDNHTGRKRCQHRDIAVASQHQDCEERDETNID